MTHTDDLLIAVHNAVIETIPVKKSDIAKKKKLKISYPKAKRKRNQPIVTREQADKKFQIFGGVKK